MQNDLDFRLIKYILFYMKDYRFKNSESLYKSREMKIKKP